MDFASSNEDFVSKTPINLHIPEFYTNLRIKDKSVNKKQPFDLSKQRFNNAFQTTFYPGPGEYNNFAEIGEKYIDTLSHSGYYVYYKNGKVVRKRQNYFASQSKRIPDEITSNKLNPGPGSYNITYKSPIFRHDRTKQIEIKTKKGKAPFDNSILKTNFSLLSRINADEAQIGPGYYKVNDSMIKPKIKSITFGKTIENKVNSIINISSILEDENFKEHNNVPVEIQRIKEEKVRKLMDEKYNFIKNVPLRIKKERLLSSKFNIQNRLNDYSDISENNIPGKKIDKSIGPGTYNIDYVNNKTNLTFSFGQGPRFSKPNGSSMVGPGSYEKDKEEIKKSILLPSFSTTSKMDEINLFKQNIPGPGKYNISTGISKIINSKNHSNVGIMGLEKRFKMNQLSNQMPGPCNYNPILNQTKINKPYSIFLSKSKKKLNNTIDNESPCTGLYNVEGFKSMSEAKILKKFSKGGGTNLFKFHKVTPGQKPAFLHVSPRFADNKINDKKGPSPGSYNVLRVENKNTYISQCERKGISLLSYNPGPGQYKNPLKDWIKKSFNLKFAK